MVPRRWAVAYLALQAVLVVAWWSAMVASDAVREVFELDADRPEVLDAYLLADLVVLAGGSAVAATAVARRLPWARVATTVAAAGAAYPTLQLAAWVLGGGDGAIGLGPMAVASVVTGAIVARPPS